MNVELFIKNAQTDKSVRTSKKMFDKRNKRRNERQTAIERRKARQLKDINRSPEIKIDTRYTLHDYLNDNYDI